ncbi:MAG TPA: hypothetical protein ENJ51_04430 [Leucothrix mucor]|uniref:Uncharacterized protein n=1 Tax=Leucothrix mucor TaxID=45248 RepID=A0A7V2SYY1_LEUMU|nr:hypothetical protein [Leucothrix mucor]
MIQKSLETWGVYYIDNYINNKQFYFPAFSPEKITKIALWLSFLVGFLATLITVSFDLILIADQPLLSVSPSVLALIAVVNVLVIVLEFWLLFHIGFIVTARYIHEAEQQQSLGLDIRRTLVRAVLELDEPAPERSFGLNPYRKRSRHYWLLVALYKVKVLFSNILAKVLLRKIVGRTSARTYVPFISTLITGFWDAWVQASVLKEVRLRISAKLYILDVISALKQSDPSQDYVTSLARTVAVRIELFGNYNANLDYLLNQIESLYSGSVSNQDKLFETSLFLEGYTKLSAIEQKNISQIACRLMALKRGLLSKEEKEVLKKLNIDDSKFTIQRHAMMSY